jgi:hypothetical protein
MDVGEPPDQLIVAIERVGIMDNESRRRTPKNHDLIRAILADHPHQTRSAGGAPSGGWNDPGRSEARP